MVIFFCILDCEAYRGPVFGRAFFIFLTSLAFGGAMCEIVSFVEWSCCCDAIDVTMGAPPGALPGAFALFSCPCPVVALSCWGVLGSLIM